MFLFVLFASFLGGKGKKFSDLSDPEKKTLKRNVLIFEIVMGVVSALFVVDFLLDNSSVLILPGILGLIFTGLLYYQTYRLR